MFTLKLEKDNLPKLKKRVEELTKHSVSIGMFKEQGQHTESGFDSS